MDPKAFGSVLVWRLAPGFELDLSSLNDQLANNIADDPRPYEPYRLGFAAPLGNIHALCHQVDATKSLICMEKAERLVPAKVLSQRVEKAIKAQEKELGYKPPAKARQEIKEQVRCEMLPAAFVSRSRLYALIQPPYLYVGTGSLRRGEDLLDLLRLALGSLKVLPVRCQRGPSSAFTRWFIEGHIEGHERLTLGERFTVHGDEKREVLKGQWPFQNESRLSDLVADGLRVTQLGVNWMSPTLEDQVSLSLGESLAMTGIKWPSVIQSKAADDVGEDDDAATLMQATVLILSDEITGLFHDIMNALGGEAVPASEKEEMVSDALI